MTQARRAMESVWDYPRPPAVRAAHGLLVEVVHGGRLVASTRRALRVLETSHPPVFYLPPEDVDTARLSPGGGMSVCEWKGQARYWDLRVGTYRSSQAAWSYPDPLPGYEMLRDFLAFYPNRVDGCSVDGELVRAQKGGFYGGWITSEINGPFKGGPDTIGW